MFSNLQKAINLVKKTGDKLIVFDSIDSESAYVIMGMKDYENLVLGKSEVRGLTEEELLDKINRDIAIWKSEQEFGNEIAFGDEEKLANFEQINEAKKRLSKNWSIPSNIKNAAEEVIEEDRQYLEEII